MKVFLCAFIIICLALGLSSTSHAQIVLEEDINQQPASSDPRYFAMMDNILYFEAETPQSGRELFSYNFNSSTLKQELDLQEGQEYGNAEFITSHNGLIYFSGRQTSGKRLLVYDPLTGMVDELTTADGQRTENPVFMTAFDERIFMQLDDDVIGQELGIYNTVTQELIFHDLHPDFSGFPLDFTPAGDALYFSARSPDTESELWRYDVDTKTFAPVDYELIGSEHPSSLRGMKHTGGRIFCYADTDSLDDEMWIYDPADNTMRMGPETFPGSPWSRPFGFTALLGKVYFAARGSGGVDREVYAMDLADYSVELIADINPNGQSNPTGFFTNDDKLYYAASPNDTQKYIYEFDPLTNQNVQITTLDNGGQLNYISTVQYDESTVILTGDNLIHGDEPHMFNFQNKSIDLIVDVNQTTIGSDIFNVTAIDGKLYMSADEYINGRQVWQYDPATGDANLLIDADIQIKPHGFTGLDGRVYFSGIHPDNGYGIHYWDDSNNEFGSTDYLTPSNIGGVDGITALNDKIYFVPASHPVVEDELYVYDPSTNTAELLHDFNNDPEVESFAEVHGIFQGDLIVAAQIGFRKELFRMDGETEEITALPEFHPAPDTGATISAIWFQDDAIYIGVFTDRYDLYRYVDGANDYERLTFIESNGMEYFAWYQDKLFMTTKVASAIGTELYSFDPGSNELTLEAEIIPGSSSASIRDLTVFNDQLFFTADTDAFGRELWSFDGSEAKVFADVFPGPNGSDCHNLTLFNDKLYFSADDGTYGEELWSVAECLNVFVDTEAQVDENPGTIDLSVSGGILPYTFVWNTGDQTEDINDAEAGDYSCTVTDASGCITVLDVTVELTTKTNHLKGEDVVLFPNPSNDFVNIKWPSIAFEKDTNIYFYNAQGILVNRVKIDQSVQGLIQVNIQNWPAGIYFVQVGDEKISRLMKFVRQ